MFWSSSHVGEPLGRSAREEDLGGLEWRLEMQRMGDGHAGRPLEYQ